MNKLYTFCLLAMALVANAQNPAGRDPIFNPFTISANNYFVNEPITICKVAPDGKLVLLYGIDKFIRLNPDNTLDTTFSAKTFSGTTMSESGANVRNFIIQPDGKILAYGSFASYDGVGSRNIVRMNLDGSIDTSFQSGTGFTTPSTGSSIVTDIELLANGKMVVTGGFNTYNGTANIQRMMRLNANGTIDTGFACPINTAIASCLQPTTGKLILFGATTYNIITSVSNLSRFSPTGVYDNTFNSGGAGFAPITANSYNNIFLPQPDGKIIALGAFNTYNGVTVNGIARINENGSHDATFATGTGFTTNGYKIKSAYLQPDGKVVIAGSFATFNGAPVRRIIRLNTDGSLDTTFTGGVNSDSNVNADAGDVNTVARNSDGSFYAGGSFKIYNNETVNYILKADTDGVRIQSFRNHLKGFDGPVTSFVEQPDGKIIVGGKFYSYNGITTDKIARLNPDGTLDNTFVLGSAVVTTPNLKDVALALQSNGKILVSSANGSINGYPCNNYVVRLNTNGSIDTSFANVAGLSSAFDDTNESTWIKILVAANDKIYLGGNLGPGLNRIYTRLNADGTNDAAFPTGINGWIVDMELQPDGKLLLLTSAFWDGILLHDVTLMRVQPDGQYDYTFNCTKLPTEFKLMGDGKIIAKGEADVTQPLYRLNADGSIDNTFNNTSEGDVFFQDYFIVAQPDGKVIVGTGSDVANGPNGLRRVNADGSVDSDFVAPDTFDGFLKTVLLQSDGKILAGGNFKSYDEITDNNITRLRGNEFYQLTGTNRIDANANGCDAGDQNFPFMKFNVSDGTVNIPNQSGNYAVALGAGTFTLTPQLENPAYFMVSPSSVTVNFPGDANPTVQNFCVSPVGSHTDLEVTIFPKTVARPGFDASYLIVYKNKGNVTQSGSVTLTFNDTVADYIAANPMTTTAITNSLSWDFTELMPFETRQISLTLNLNSPVETPALNAGDVLNYTVVIASSGTDEVPSDNQSILNQTVVNSFDPNDKTCLEGAIVGVDKIGEFVHYVIRFENTGSFPAENVIVQDIIDPSKYDIATLTPIAGSHLFTTRIDADGKAEFEFQGINLPTDDASNDGFVAFKIKLKNSLIVGDIFSNIAAIYFDYNSAIVTDPASTLIQQLSNPEVSFDAFLSLAPNPASQMLYIHKKQALIVKSMTVYNMLGQIVVALTGEADSIDVSSLETGTYIISLQTDKGMTAHRFIKN